MARRSAQQTTQPKTSTSRDTTWQKKRAKKACQLRDLIIEWKETEYLPEKEVEATEVPIRMSDVVICRRRIYKLLNAKEKCIKSMKRWRVHNNSNRQLMGRLSNRIQRS